MNIKHLLTTAAVLTLAFSCSDSPSGDPVTDTVADQDTATEDAADSLDASEDRGVDSALDASEDPTEDPVPDAGDPDSPTPDTDDADDAAASTDPDTEFDTEIDAAETADAATDEGGRDAGDADVSEPDTDASTDADAADTPRDATEPDAGAECSYLDLSLWIVECDGGYRYLREWTEIGGASLEACPAYYTLGSDRHESADAALASEGCNADCLAAAATSVSYIRCGRRSGYIIYRSGRPECPELYEFSEGIFESFEEYDAAHPCP